jgi:tetratricopeptide (TPR) repeat protein
MLADRYDNMLSTTTDSARDSYVAAVDLMLAGQAGVCSAFEKATQDDPEFAMGWAGLARAHQYAGDMAAARQAIGKARALSGSVTAREAAHIGALELLISGQTGAAYRMIRAHVAAHPRDAVIAQTCSSIFGLIGFSGLPGREAELLAFNASLLPHYGEDWWAISQYAFALCETGNLPEAERQIDIAMELNPANAHGAHVRSHVSYEMGETDTGREYLATWLAGYDPAGVMFTHLSWHEALWALEQGDLDAMWTRIDAAVAPQAGSGGPAINVLTDTASILRRATLAGVEVKPERWQGVSDFAQKAFPETGNAFIDIHAALAHAMAGREDAVKRIIDHPAGPAADLVPDLAAGLEAAARQDWGAAARRMMGAMADLARIGGSRAQRDMVEQTLLTALVRQGKIEEARDIAALRRPVLAPMVA